MGQGHSALGADPSLYQLPQYKYSLKNKLNSALAVWKNKHSPFDQLLEYRKVVNQQYQITKICDQFMFRYQHRYLVSTLYLKCEQQGLKGCGQIYKGSIYYQQPIAKLSQIKDIPFLDTLHMYAVAFHGFDILFKKYGYFDIFEDMFHICENGKLKVWCNSAPHRLQPESYLLDSTGEQQDMIHRIIYIIDQNSDHSQKNNIKRQFEKQFRKQVKCRCFQDAIFLYRQICRKNMWQPTQRLNCIASFTKEDIQNLLHAQESSNQNNQDLLFHTFGSPKKSKDSRTNFSINQKIDHSTLRKRLNNQMPVNYSEQHNFLPTNKFIYIPQNKRNMNRHNSETKIKQEFVSKNINYQGNAIYRQKLPYLQPVNNMSSKNVYRQQQQIFPMRRQLVANSKPIEHKYYQHKQNNGMNFHKTSNNHQAQMLGNNNNNLNGQINKQYKQYKTTAVKQLLHLKYYRPEILATSVRPSQRKVVTFNSNKQFANNTTCYSQNFMNTRVVPSRPVSSNINQKQKVHNLSIESAKNNYPNKLISRNVGFIKRDHKFRQSEVGLKKISNTNFVPAQFNKVHQINYNSQTSQFENTFRNNKIVQPAQSHRYNEAQQSNTINGPNYYMHINTNTAEKPRPEQFIQLRPIIRNCVLNKQQNYQTHIRQQIEIGYQKQLVQNSQKSDNQNRQSSRFYGQKQPQIQDEIRVNSNINKFKQGKSQFLNTKNIKSTKSKASDHINQNHNIQLTKQSYNKQENQVDEYTDPKLFNILALNDQWDNYHDDIKINQKRADTPKTESTSLMLFSFNNINNQNKSKSDLRGVNLIQSLSRQDVHQSQFYRNQQNSNKKYDPDMDQEIWSDLQYLRNKKHKY